MERRCFGATDIVLPIGFEGLKKREGAPLVVYSEEEMIIAISSLLDSTTLRAVMGNRAKQYIAEYYSENKIFSKFQNFIKNI